MLKVAKFGGSSMADAKQFEKVRDIVRADSLTGWKWKAAAGPAYLAALAAALPQREDVLRVKADMLANLEDKFNALLDEGKNEAEATGLVIASVGSAQELRSELDLDTDNVSRFQRVQVYNTAFYFSQVRQTNFGCNRCFTRSEAEFRQTTVQRHLTTLETATYATARTRFLTFVTTTTGFTEARTDTTTQAFTRLFGAFGRRQSI